MLTCPSHSLNVHTNMKTIGLLGGMSWESTSHYYQLLNQRTAALKGGLHSAPIIMLSVDFHPIEILMRQNRWDQIIAQLTAAALKLEEAGADFLLLCTNTMHKIAPSISQAIEIPFLHIADATAQKIVEQNIKSVGLLGTRFTMEEDFYSKHLERNYGLQVLVPGERERQQVDQIIFEELCRGKIKDSSREIYLKIISNLQKDGAQAVIAGCTEIGMLVKQNQLSAPLFDTTVLHVDAALEYALNE